MYKANDGKTPVNEIKLPYDTIKAYDTDTPLTVELYSEGEKAAVNDIAFFILGNSKDEFTNVNDYTVKDGTVTFTMPKIDTDRYYPQIMDQSGKVYSSDSHAFIDVAYNQESRALEVFPIIKEQIIREVTPAIKQYVMDNAELFVGNTGLVGKQGPKGEQGEQGKRGFKGNQGVQGVQGIQGVQGLQGEKGDRGFKGNQGEQGEQGVQGEKGDVGTVQFDTLTPEQIESLKGEDGTVNFEELTTDQLHMLTPEFILEPNGDLYYKVRGE